MRLGLWILLGSASWAAALPSGPHVAAGKAKFEMPDPAVLSIDVSHQAIIEWDSFSIEKGEIARFIQPNANAAVLNRVTSDNLSQIAGKLEANGHVYLINPNGIVMKDSAVIEAYSFIAQTYDLPDADFLAHDFQEGPLFLPPTLHSTDSENPYAAAIRHCGKIETLKIQDRGGRVYLLADRGAVEIEGEIISRGGDVRILGEYIRLQGDATIDVSSQVHAGSVRIGGDIQGKSPLFPNARQVIGGSCAKVLANGIDQAHGGSIVLFAKEAVRYLGVLEAKGGSSQGDGGFIEVSAKHDLDYQGIADLTAPFGKTGSLVLDPISIMVFAGSADTDVQIDSHPSFVAISPIASSARIRPSTIINNLMLSNVIVESSSEAGLEPGDIFIASPIIYSSKNDLTFRTTALSSGGVGGDIYVNAPIRNTGLGGSIFIESAQDIVQTNASVATSGGDIGYASARDFFWYNLTPTILQNVQAAKSLNIELGRDFIASQTVNLSANDAFSLAVGGKALLYKGTNLGSIVFECLSGPTNLIVGGDLNVDGFFQLDSDQMLTVDIGGEFFASEGALIRTLGVGLPQIAFQTGGDFKVNEHIELGIGGAGPMTYEIGGNFIIDGGSVVFQNDVVVLAQNNIEFLNGAVLDMQGTTVQSVQLEAKEDIFFQGEMAGVTNTDPIAPVSLNVSARRDFIMKPGTGAYTD